MYTKYLFLVMLLLCISFVTAAENANVFLSLKEATTNIDINKVVVYIEENEQVMNKYVPKGEILKLSLENGEHHVTIKVDDLTTEGIDYFAKTQLTVQTSLIEGVFLYSVGSLRGIVKDELDNVIPNAEIKIECGSDYGLNLPTKAYSFGTFNTEVPIGNCKVFARSEEAVSMQEFEVSKGDVIDLELNLDKVKKEKSNLLAWSLIILLVVIIVIFRWKPIKKKTKKPETIIKKEVKLVERSKDVYNTLKEKEKEIIDFILESKGSTTQAKIHYGTGIPKASLFRYVQSLEQKNVIQTQKIGKVKKIRFTDWFLGKNTSENEQ